MAEHDLHVEPASLHGFAQSVGGGAEDLRHRLAELDGHVTDMLAGWCGAAGSAYTAAWELWHRGAAEVQVGLSILTKLIDRAAADYQDNETASARCFGNG